jgi:putative oxidoreductase
MGVPTPHFMSRCTILIELLGGLAILLGAFVALGSLPMAAVLLVAMFTVHLQYGFSSIKLMAVTPTGARFGPRQTESLRHQAAEQFRVNRSRANGCADAV